MLDYLAKFGKALNDWMNTVRPTSAKTLLFIALSCGTFFVWAVAALRHTAIDIAAFGAWLAFVAAVGQISLSGYKTERMTDYNYLAHGGTPPLKGAVAGAVPVASATVITAPPVDQG